MGRLFLLFLDSNFYCCKYCHAHLAVNDHIISKSFNGGHGKAYLFKKVVNVIEGEREDRMMTTGMHTVVDIYCVGCRSLVGWKYEFAEDKEQKYKEGKFILERFQILGPDGSSYSGSHEGSDADDA